MYKIISTHIAGVSYANEDGSSRREILKGCALDYEFMLQEYLYCGEKAVRVLTAEGECVGNIPRDVAEEVYDALQKGRFSLALYKPKRYPNGSVRSEIKIYLKEYSTLK